MGTDGFSNQEPQPTVGNWMESILFIFWTRQPTPPTRLTKMSSGLDGLWAGSAPMLSPTKNTFEYGIKTTQI